MRRWNPLFLLALLMVVLAAVVFITPPGASAHSFPSSINLINGKIVAKNSDTHYFVLTFNCALSGTTGALSGKWTYEVTSSLSLTAMVEPGASCSDLTATLTGTGNLVGCGAPCTTNPTPPMLTLALKNIVATKTFFNASTSRGLCTSPTSQTCLDVEASGFSLPTPSNNFSSECGTFTCDMKAGFPYATLNLSTR
jgi:hypothetical protein